MGSFMMVKRPRASTIQQIDEIVSTSLYKSAEAFTVNEMLELCPKVSCVARMNQLMSEMLSIGLVDKVKERGMVRFKRPMASLLRKRWISESAEDICAGDNPRTITGQAARDAFIRSRKLEASSAASCGGGF